MQPSRSSRPPLVGLHILTQLIINLKIIHISLFSKCKNLEKLMVSRAWLSSSENVGVEPYNFQSRRKRPYPHLKSLIFVVEPTLYSYPLFQFYDVQENSQLMTLWSNILGINCPDNLENSQLRSLSWNLRWDGKPTIHLDNLESIWQSFSRLRWILNINAPTKLKLVRCGYDGEVMMHVQTYLNIFKIFKIFNFLFYVQHFQDFCRYCPLIEVLGLDGAFYKASPLHWNDESWKHLPKLRILSVAASLIGSIYPADLN